MKRVTWLTLAALAATSWSVVAADARSEKVTERTEKAAAEAKAAKQTMDIPSAVRGPVHVEANRKEHGARRSNKVPAGKGNAKSD